MQLVIGIPDLISPSYFPAIAAVELGLLADRGIDAELRLSFPVTQAAGLLRDGKLDLLAGAAHAPLYAFPEWQGAKLIAALSHNMYWLLVVSPEVAARTPNLGALRDVRIAAAPGPDAGIVEALVDAGVDLAATGVEIVPVPGGNAGDISFGVTAARALEQGNVDGFWANGMGAEVAVRAGTGKVLFDVRRAAVPAISFTFPALAATDAMIAEHEDVTRAAVEAVSEAQKILRADAGRATAIGRKLFPAMEAELISTLVERDAPFYSSTIDAPTVTALEGFSRRIGISSGNAGYDDVVAARFSAAWS